MQHKLTIQNDWSGAEFIHAISNIPTDTTSLYLTGHFEKRATDELVQVLRSIPPPVTKLNLNTTCLFLKRTYQELIALFDAIPIPVVELDLSGNLFDNPHTLSGILVPLEKHVLNLNLRNTDFQLKKREWLFWELRNFKGMVNLNMQEIPPINAPNKACDDQFKIFLRQVNRDILEINKLIRKYNGASDRIKQIKKLQTIYRFKQNVENTYSDQYISMCPDYVKIIHFHLFEDFQKQFASLGITSLYNVTKLNPRSEFFNKKPLATLEELLADMPPVKAITMCAILESGAGFNKLNLINLFQSYQNFFHPSNNDIQFLGGNNSKNFKIIPKNGAFPYVLKIENRLTIPRTAEVMLRENNLRHVLTPISVERQVTIGAGRNTVTRTLLITQLCPGSISQDLEKHKSDHSRYVSALSIYSQMSEILLKILENGCVFTDLKNDNWLLDADGMLMLADTKTFMFTDSDGQVDLKKNMEQWYDLCSTAYMNPPELDMDSSLDLVSPFDADKAHAYMLGKNLYHYLTRCSWFELIDNHDADIYNFNYSIFKTHYGNALQLLVKGLIKPNPALRMSTKDALNVLNKLQAQNLATDCQRIVNAIQSQAFKGQNTKIFCKLMREEIRTAVNPSQLQIVRQQLNVESNSNQQDAQKYRNECQTLLYEIKNSAHRCYMDTLEYCFEMTRKLRIATFAEFKEFKQELILKNKEFHNARQNQIAQCQLIIADMRLKYANVPDCESYCNWAEEQLNSLLMNKFTAFKRDLNGKCAEFIKMTVVVKRHKDQQMDLQKKQKTLFDNGPKALQVKEALAEHRPWVKSAVIYPNDLRLNENKAAASYHFFKSEMDKRLPVGLNAVAEIPKEFLTVYGEALSVSAAAGFAVGILFGAALAGLIAGTTLIPTFGLGLFFIPIAVGTAAVLGTAFGFLGGLTGIVCWEDEIPAIRPAMIM